MEKRYEKLAKAHKDNAEQKLADYAKKYMGFAHDSLVSEETHTYGEPEPPLMTKKKVLINKASGGSGSGTTVCRLVLPQAMVRRLGLTADERDVTLTLVDDKIVIEKAKKQ